jgi:uncharacterized protein with von Willebrand factor type A (vWA) domain
VFVDFMYALREGGINVTPTEWLTLMQALAQGHSRADLSVFYHLARAILVKSEALFDRYDRVFASFFEGVESQFSIDDEVLKWLENPVLPRNLTDEERAKLATMDLESLRKEFEKRLREQKERHDGGSHWVGTGGVSPFGQGGENPAGVRVGAGGGRSAVQVATERRFQNLRNDRVLDTRQIGTALRKLRKLAKDEACEELDIDRTIDRTAREGGEIELVFGPPRHNRIKLLLLMDVGGSMDPHALVSERLFSAAHAATHFKAFEYFYFHNCVYDELFKDMRTLKGEKTNDVLRRVDETWKLVIVGDAYMHPFELLQTGGAIDYRRLNHETGKNWLEKLRKRIPSSVWLNPEQPRIWDAPSIRVIRGIFPMFPLTVDGIGEAVDTLRGRKANRPDLDEASSIAMPRWR